MKKVVQKIVTESFEITQEFNFTLIKNKVPNAFEDFINFVGRKWMFLALQMFKKFTKH